MVSKAPLSPPKKMILVSSRQVKGIGHGLHFLVSFPPAAFHAFTRYTDTADAIVHSRPIAVSICHLQEGGQVGWRAIVVLVFLPGCCTSCDLGLDKTKKNS